MTDFDQFHRPRKSLGQHFLQNPKILEQIADAVASNLHDHLVEIGPGQGALTQYLVSHCKRLDLIEIDKNLIKKLQSIYRGCDHLIIHHQDVLEFDFNTLATAKNKIRLVGNLPYNISTPLLFYLLDFLNIIIDMNFLLQKEVVDRITAKINDPHYGRLSVIWQYYCDCEKLFEVPPQAFHPPPKVYSAFIRLVPNHTRQPQVENAKMFEKVVQLAFSQRRKMISNNFKGLMTAQDWVKLNIDPHCRAQELSIEEFVRLSNFLNSQNDTS